MLPITVKLTQYLIIQTKSLFASLGDRRTLPTITLSYISSYTTFLYGTNGLLAKFYPFYGTVVLCTTIIGNFRRRPSRSLSTFVLFHSMSHTKLIMFSSKSLLPVIVPFLAHILSYWGNEMKKGIKIAGGKWKLLELSNNPRNISNQ